MQGIRVLVPLADKYYRARDSKQELQPLANAIVAQPASSLVRLKEGRLDRGAS